MTLSVIPERSSNQKDTQIKDSVNCPADLMVQVEAIRQEAKTKLPNKSLLGQFMTPVSLARLLASLFQTQPAKISLLDAGAGVGSLSAAVVEALGKCENKPTEIVITMYEIDPHLVYYAKKTLELCRIFCIERGINFKGEIHQTDFIRAGVNQLLDDSFRQEEELYNCVILNPPYHKIRSDSIMREQLRRAGIETSNLYTAFLWLASRLLSQDGELVAITPRSFCNGPYFKAFRKAFLADITLKQIHVFNNRNQAFKEDAVLQENIIFSGIKQKPAETSLIALSSINSTDNALMNVHTFNYTRVVNFKDPELFIHIAPNEGDDLVIQKMARFTGTIEQLNLKVSTGRVVEFRATDLLQFYSPDVLDTSDFLAPLIWPGNMLNGFIKWPLIKGQSKKPDALKVTKESANLLIAGEIYVLVRRVSAKEEKRRINAAIYDPGLLQDNLAGCVRTDTIGFENHLNYYHINGHGLPLEFAKGLTAYLNSQMVDHYFRHFNGHTQVNAMDLRTIPYPTSKELEKIGALIGESFPDQIALDSLIEREIFNGV